MNNLENGDLGEQQIAEEMKDNRREDYLGDKEEGIEETITEYLNLSTLVNVIAKHHLYEPLGYGSRNQFENGDHSFGSLVDFRNSVAHPVKSLRGTDGTPSSLWRNIETCERALFHLHNSSSE